MSSTVFARSLSIVLAALLAAPSGFAQTTPTVPLPAAPVAADPATAVPAAAAPKRPGTPLVVAVLEGDNVVNSLSLLRATAPVVEIRDQNDFPVEGATVVFELPQQGAGGTFTGGATSFTTRSDSHGQATSPLIIPRLTGKFSIKVAATVGDRKGEMLVHQTNATGAYAGPAIPLKPWYMKKRNWVLAGGAVAAVVVVIAVTGKSSSSSQIVISPGTPVFQ